MAGDDDNIVHSMGPQELIGRAIAILISRYDVSKDAAFEILVRRAAGSRKRVREIAEAIVEQTDI